MALPLRFAAALFVAASAVVVGQTPAEQRYVPVHPGAAAAAPVAAPTPAAAARRTSADILAAAPADAWRPVLPERLLVMALADGRQVLIELAPDFAPAHVANIVALARNRWWDGESLYRVQDNYVAQWGDPTEKKPLPPDVPRTLPAEYERSIAGLAMSPLPYRDSYAATVGFVSGMPAGSDGAHAWLAHCYGMGVARDLSPDTGSGGDLYAVIGHAPRHLDRNIALVGRVLAGMEQLSARPRGAAPMGVYVAAEQRTPIRAVRLAADLPAGERPTLEVLRTDTASYADWLTLRANRQDDFFVRPAGAIDLCNAMPPVRRIGG